MKFHTLPDTNFLSKTGGIRELELHLEIQVEHSIRGTAKTPLLKDYRFSEQYRQTSLFADSVSSVSLIRDSVFALKPKVSFFTFDDMRISRKHIQGCRQRLVVDPLDVLLRRGRTLLLRPPLDHARQFQHFLNVNLVDQINSQNVTKPRKNLCTLTFNNI